MKIKDMIKRLTEIAAMTDAGDEAQVVVKVPDEDGRTFYDRCCPELVEVVEASFIPGEYYREAGNEDNDSEVVKAVAIRPNAIDGTFGGSNPIKGDR